MLVMNPRFSIRAKFRGDKAENASRVHKRPTLEPIWYNDLHSPFSTRCQAMVPEDIREPDLAKSTLQLSSFLQSLLY